jgi:hypothetical protein
LSYLGHDARPRVRVSRSRLPAGRTAGRPIRPGFGVSGYLVVPRPLRKRARAECPRPESNQRTRFRKPLLYPLSYGGPVRKMLQNDGSRPDRQPYWRGGGNERGNWQNRADSSCAPKHKVVVTSADAVTAEIPMCTGARTYEDRRRRRRRGARRRPFERTRRRAAREQGRRRVSGGNIDFEQLRSLTWT